MTKSLQKSKTELATNFDKPSECKTIVQVLEGSFNSVAKIKKESSEATILGLLSNLLVRMQDSFNIENKMNESQIIDCAKELISDFYYLTLEDFMLCFSRGKKNFYGEVYGRLDISVIYSWLNKYTEERMELAEKINREKHQSTKEVESKSKGYGWHKTRQ